jgi:HK97 family phage prohead protease
MERELRNVQGKVEVRMEGEGEEQYPIIEGYAIVWDAETFIGSPSWGWYEKVSRTALKGADMSDVVAKWNHDTNYPLARTGSVNNLELIQDEIGLKYRFKAMNEDGEKCAENIKLGIVRGSSFEFTAKKTSWTEDYKEGKELRTIEEIETLYDVAPVLREAYPQTTVNVRSREFVKEEKRTQLSVLELKIKSLKIK